MLFVFSVQIFTSRRCGCDILTKEATTLDGDGYSWSDFWGTAAHNVLHTLIRTIRKLTTNYSVCSKRRKKKKWFDSYLGERHRIDECKILFWILIGWKFECSIGITIKISSYRISRLLASGNKIIEHFLSQLFWWWKFWLRLDTNIFYANHMWEKQKKNIR